MDERLLQLKQLKLAYKKLRARTGRVWSVIGWICFALWLPAVVATVCVRGYHYPVAQQIDLKIWEPLKAAMGLKLEFSQIWLAIWQYGPAVCILLGVLCLLALWGRIWMQSGVRKSDEYLSYRTMKLALKTEKEEK